jgi:hypothetical protein
MASSVDASASSASTGGPQSRRAQYPGSHIHPGKVRKKPGRSSTRTDPPPCRRPTGDSEAAGAEVDGLRDGALRLRASLTSWVEVKEARLDRNGESSVIPKRK